MLSLWSSGRWPLSRVPFRCCDCGPGAIRQHLSDLPFFALYAIGASWGIGYQNPLLVEGICFGHAQIDTLYHATIANMIRTYGVPSTGLDGLPYILYHVGSHWLFARLSNLINIPVIDFYNRAYAVIFVPFGLSSLGIFATAMIPRWQSFAEMGMAEIAPEAAQRQTGALRIGPLFWFVLVAAYVGLLPYAAGYLPIIARNSVIVSESYAVAVAVSLLARRPSSLIFVIPTTRRISGWRTACWASSCSLRWPGQPGFSKSR